MKESLLFARNAPALFHTVCNYEEIRKLVAFVKRSLEPTIHKLNHKVHTLEAELRQLRDESDMQFNYMQNNPLQI